MYTTFIYCRRTGTLKVLKVYNSFVWHLLNLASYTTWIPTGRYVGALTVGS